MPDGTINRTALAEFIRLDGRSIRKLAKLVEVSPSYLAKILRGDKAPSLALALRLSTQLGIKLGAFYAVDPSLSTQIDVLESVESTRAS